MATAVAIPAGPAFAGVPAGGNGGYEQWPPLCDFCSAGNNMCLYATFCLPCLAGHLFTNVLGRPGCCMKLAVLYTFCAIVGYGLYAIGAAPTWMGSANGDEGEEANGDEGGEATDSPFIQIQKAADTLGRVMQAVCSALVCYTLIKVSPRATRPRRNLTAPAPRDRSARPLSFLFRVPRRTTPPAPPTGSSGAAQPLGWPAARQLLRGLHELVLLRVLHHYPAGAVSRMGGQTVQPLLAHWHLGERPRLNGLGACGAKRGGAI